MPQKSRVCWRASAMESYSVWLSQTFSCVGESVSILTSNVACFSAASCTCEREIRLRTIEVLSYTQGQSRLRKNECDVAS